MTIQGYQKPTTLDFGTDAVQATVISPAVRHRIVGSAVVINLSATDATVHGPYVTRIPALQSTTLVDTEISSDCIAVLQIGNSASIAADARWGWHDFYRDRSTSDQYPELLKSPQHQVGTVSLNKAAILRQSDLPAVETEFDVRLNLWFSPAGTDCGIHNEHDFIEVHTQLAGSGRMQKFYTRAAESLYEEYLLAVGSTNPATFCHEQHSRFIYPWHQYRADTDCVWLAVEYHQL